MARNKGIALALFGTGAMAVIALRGTAMAKSTSGKPTNKKELAYKYSEICRVPVSLILTTLLVGRMTKKTADDIWPKAKSVVGPIWDGTAQGLKKLETQIALTAYYLSLWWRRYKRHPQRWILAGYAYVLGPGRVRQIMGSDMNALPKSLPSDFERVKRAYQRALTHPSIRQILSFERYIPQLGVEKAITETITGHQARLIFGSLSKSLSNAYNTLASYDPHRIVEHTKLDAGSIKAARQFLDSTNAMLSKYYAQMPESNEPLALSLKKKVAFAIKETKKAIATINDLFGSNWRVELTSEMLKAAVHIPKTIVSTTAEAIGLNRKSAAIAVAGIMGLGLLVLSMKN